MKRGLPLCTLMGVLALALGSGVDCSGSGNGSSSGSGGSTSSTGGASGTLTGATGSTDASGTTGSSPTATTGNTSGSTTTATSGTSTTSSTSTASVTTTTTTTSATTTAATTTAATTSTSSGGPTAFGTIFTIVLENHDYKEVVGSSGAPYINQLIAQGGLATNYFDSGTHPSLPNYLYLISGDTQYPGYLDVDPTTYPFPVSGDNLGNQMRVANVAWRSYQESAGGTCVLSANNSHYAPKHDPFLYFDDIQSNQALCDKTNVDYGAFSADLAGGAYKYMWITPNLIDDGHDPVDSFGNATDPVASLTACDTWLSNEIPKILGSQAYEQNGVLFITWDEAEGRNGDDPDQIPMIILSPRLKMAGYKSTTHFTHANYLATVEDMMSLPRLGAAMGIANMMEFFQ